MAKETNKPEAKHFTIRDSGPEDAPFLAKCVMAGMHYYDFDEITKDIEGLFTSLTECEKRTDLLYTYSNTMIAEADGKVADSPASMRKSALRPTRATSALTRSIPSGNSSALTPDVAPSS